jgi:environmental stress-induced protein Ves/predicted kinase
VIVWLNGGFAAGKTTLAEELHRRLPDAVVYDPEDIGLMLWKWMAPNDDFQDLPSWRELVVATALSLRRHHTNTLIVPMSLIRDAYRDEILGGLAEAGEDVLHVFLDADAGVLRERLAAREAPVEDPGANESAREWAPSRVAAATAASARQPSGTLMLRSDRLTPRELADAVLSATSRSRPWRSGGKGTTVGRDTPSTIQVLRSEQHRRMPWRNGGGVTYEVAASPGGTHLADFDWRISIAEVEASGPFSAFPEIDRTIILIEGEWMALTVDGRRHRFGIRDPFSFDGGGETLCEVPTRSRDLNVMTRRGRVTATVAVFEGDSPDRGAIDGSETMFVCLTPPVVLVATDGTELELNALDGALTTGSAPLTIRGDGAVVVIQLERAAG